METQVAGVAVRRKLTKARQLRRRPRRKGRDTMITEDSPVGIELPVAVVTDA